MNRYQISWREFLESGIQKDTAVLCEGETAVYAPTEEAALKKFKRAFPLAGCTIKLFVRAGGLSGARQSPE